jgi:hypothetical protein
VDVHLAYQAVLDFQAEGGSWPGAADVDAVIERCEALSAARKGTDGAGQGRPRAVKRS